MTRAFATRESLCLLFFPFLFFGLFNPKRSRAFHSERPASLRARLLSLRVLLAFSLSSRSSAFSRFSRAATEDAVPRLRLAPFFFGGTTCVVQVSEEEAGLDEEEAAASVSMMGCGAGCLRSAPDAHEQERHTHRMAQDMHTRAQCSLAPFR